MKELDPLTLIAVFQEMLGPLLWLLIALALGGSLAFAVLILREKKIVSRRLAQSELPGLLGGVAALVLMVKVSASGFTDAAGPADWLLMVLIFSLGFIGTTILAYTAMGWLFGTRGRAKTAAAPSDRNQLLSLTKQ